MADKVDLLDMTISELCDIWCRDYDAMSPETPWRCDLAKAISAASTEDALRTLSSMASWFNAQGKQDKALMLATYWVNY